MLGADVSVVQSFGFFGSQCEDLFDSGCVRDVADHLLIGTGAHLLFNFHPDGFEVEPELLEDVHSDALAERLPSIDELLNVFDFEAVAKVRIPAASWAFISAGSDDEWTLRRNRTGFERFLLRPRMLVDVSNLDLSCDVYGQKIAMPILVAPTGSHQQAHADGEIATVKAAGAAKTIMAVSTNSSYPLEKIAGAASGWGFLRGHGGVS